MQAVKPLDPIGYCWDIAYSARRDVTDVDKNQGWGAHVFTEGHSWLLIDSIETLPGIFYILLFFCRICEGQLKRKKS